VDIAVVCISTLDDGLIAYNYIRILLDNGILVVTSEKGAVGNYFPELKQWVGEGKIGYSAVVGGGTRLLHQAKLILSSETTEIHLVINGTLNYIFYWLGQGKSLEEVIDDVKRLHYAEPGAESPNEIIDTEANKDVPMKIASFINLCGLGEIQAREIMVKPIGKEDLNRLVEEKSFRRYIVSLSRREQEEDVIGGFKFEINGWYVSAGFKDCRKNPLSRYQIPKGVDNAIWIYGPDLTFFLYGPGAGPEHTVRGAIMRDLEDLLNIG